MSPLSFSLVIVLLSTIIASHDQIQGIKIGDDVHVMSLYADDILLYLSNPLLSVPALVTLLDLSGKSLDFKWPSDYLRYLGLNISGVKVMI